MRLSFDDFVRLPPLQQRRYLLRQGVKLIAMGFIPAALYSVMFAIEAQKNGLSFLSAMWGVLSYYFTSLLVGSMEHTYHIWKSRPAPE